MGEMEKKHARRMRQSWLQNAIILSVGTAGVLGVALLAPNALSVMKKLGLSPKPRQKESIVRARRNLIAQGVLREEGGVLELTKDGEILLELIRHKHSRKKKKRWDKKWRMLIFDIPERKKTSRERTRQLLIEYGFVRLQDSVWIYPYPCDDFVAVMKTHLLLGKELAYCIVDTIEGDATLRTHFKLRT